jgi:hypothetical protein
MRDWETRSFKYVLGAIDSAQRRQQKLWDAIINTRGKDGLVPIKWPAIEEFVESCRRTHSLMIDLETVAGEYEAKFDSKAGSSGKNAAPKKATAKPQKGKPGARRGK